MARAKKRADGRCCAQICLGRDADGRKRYKSVYAKSPAELKEKETAVRLQLGRGLDVLSRRDGFAAWAGDWIRLREKEDLTARQMDNHRRTEKLWKDEPHSCGIGQGRDDDMERVLIALSYFFLKEKVSKRTLNSRLHPLLFLDFRPVTVLRF